MANPAFIVDDCVQLKKYFCELSIQIAGTVEEPLFVLKDVAAYVGDKNYIRSTKDYSCDEKICLCARDKLGRINNITFLTEFGLYKYAAHKDEAFAEWVAQTLITLRLQTINKVNLQAKINRDKLRLATAAFESEAKTAKILSSNSKFRNKFREYNQSKCLDFTLARRLYELGIAPELPDVIQRRFEYLHTDSTDALDDSDIRTIETQVNELIDYWREKYPETITYIE